MLKKEDWEKVLKDSETDKERIIRTYELGVPQLDNLIELAKKKISELPESEKDPMPDEVKELIKEIK